MRRPAFVVLAFLLAASAHAGDRAELSFIGFSEDRKHLAFEQFGTQDGSGFPYAQYYVIDTMENRFASPPVKVLLESETSGVEEARAKTKQQAGAVLKQHAIVEGATGDLIVHRLATDLDAKPTTKDGEIKTRFARRVWASHAGRIFQLVIHPVVANEARCKGLDGPIQKLHVELRDEAAGTATILQNDGALPEARGCPIAYGLNSIYWNGDKLAVFIEVHTPGFEGPDIRHMVVTGTQEDPDFTRQ